LSFIEKLKNRWNVKSGVQVLLILIVFTCTGSTIVVLKHLIGISNDSSSSHRVLFYLAVLPIYNIMLLAYGFLFGQFNFFLDFEKKFFKRIVGLFKKRKND
jgi:hypothetical protein